MKGFKKLAVCGMAIMLGLGSPIGNSVMHDLGRSEERRRERV